MPGHYQPVLVFFSFVISFLASWVALDVSARIHLHRDSLSRYFWLAFGSLGMGVGIWSMHYVGMLACQMPIPVLYDWPTVLLSMLAAVLACGVALFVVTRGEFSSFTATFASIFMGGGIASMHYIGMSAMRMRDRIEYSGPIVLVSVLVAMLISRAALQLTFGARTLAPGWSHRKSMSALLMGLAIPAMHYIGMAAAHWTGEPGTYTPAQWKYAIAISGLSVTGVVLTTVIVLTSILISANADGQVTNAEDILKDATQSIDQQMAHSTRLQGAFRAGGVGLWECDPHTGLFHADSALHDLWEVKQGDLSMTRDVWKSRVHPNDLAALDRHWAESLRISETYQNEHRILKQNGEYKHVRSVATITRTADGSPERVLGMSWDITAERQREHDNADLASRFRMTLEAIGDAVISTDQQQRIIFMNRVASQLTGWDVEDSLGKPLSEVFIIRDEKTDALRKNVVQDCVDGDGLLLAEDGVLVSKTGLRHNIREHVSLMDDGSAAVITFQDITEARRLEKDLVHSATHDSLTGLANRTKFEKLFNSLWQDTRGNQRKHCLAIIDLDRFKIINDTSGHLAGDTLLRDIAHIIQQGLRPSDVVARMGGDEFLVLFVDTDITEANTAILGILRAISGFHLSWQGRFYDTTASVGVVEWTCSSPDPQTLTSQADVAMFTAKRNGRNQISVYEDDTGAASKHHQEMRVVADLRKSLEENRFELYAQPIVEINALTTAKHFELLIRMRDESNHVIPPNLFIPAAERYGLMPLIDRWVIKKAFEQARSFNAATFGLHFAINLSASSLSDPTLWVYIADQLESTGLSPTGFTFEVTETALIRNLENARAFLVKARTAGSRVALDDFGTGLSSLSYLKQFPLDSIKVDGAFIRHLLQNPLDQAIVSAMSKIAQSMGAHTVAECVEDSATIEMLLEMNIDYIQGWATGKPQPLTEVLKSRCKVPTPGTSQGNGSSGLIPTELVLPPENVPHKVRL